MRISIFLICIVFANLELRSEPVEIQLPFPELNQDVREQDSIVSNPTSHPESLNQNSTPKVEDPKLSDKGTKESNPPTPKKKKKKGDGIDPSLAPFQRGKALLSRNKPTEAEKEFSEAASKEGENATKAKLDSANLMGRDSKASEASGIVEKIEDPDNKTKAQYELAKSLDQIGSEEAQEKAYKEYLKLVTAFPIHSDLTPRSHLAIAIHLLRRREFRPSLHHAIKVVQDFPEFEDRPLGYYYSGRIYESAWAEKDIGRAKKYYDLYLESSKDQKLPKGRDFRKDAEIRRKRLEELRVF